MEWLYVWGGKKIRVGIWEFLLIFCCESMSCGRGILWNVWEGIKRVSWLVRWNLITFHGQGLSKGWNMLMFCMIRAYWKDETWMTFHDQSLSKGWNMIMFAWSEPIERMKHEWHFTIRAYWKDETWKCLHDQSLLKGWNMNDISWSEPIERMKHRNVCMIRAYWKDETWMTNFN